MLRADMLKTFANEKGCNLFVLPSSVHEILLICAEKEMCVAELKAIVSSVNRNPNLIEAEEVLSDSVYYYDCRIGEISIAKEDK